jgi:hypothetical protein
MLAQSEKFLNLESVRQSYDEMAGTWTGCDWPTCFGDEELDLNGWTSAEAVARSEDSLHPDAVDDWRLAAQWLCEVEHKADEAAVQGALALAAANAGYLLEALDHARRAWLFEKEIGRPASRPNTPSWQQVYKALEQVHELSRLEAASQKAEAPPANIEEELVGSVHDWERLVRCADEFD